MTNKVYATKAEAVDDSYFQLGANFFTRCSTQLDSAHCTPNQTTDKNSMADTE